MSATVITVAQQKGGAGKTTIAAQLAVAIANEGHSVTVMDIDPQGSLSGWHRARGAAPWVLDEIALSAVAGWRVATEMDRLRRKVDYVVIDSPPHAETETKHALNAADLALIPMQPSPMDLWATQTTLDTAQKEGTTALLVLNRVPFRGKVVDLVRAKIDEAGLPRTQTTIGNRTAFAASMMEGMGVTETAWRSTAAAETRALLKEVRRTLRDGGK